MWRNRQSTSAFTLQWSITIDGAPATCADIAGAKILVSIDFFDQSNKLPCNDGDGATEPQEPGSYLMFVSLLARNGLSISTLGPISATIVDGPVDLGELTFEFGMGCDAATCPLGCCDDDGACITQTDSACGRFGTTCVNCEGAAEGCDVNAGLCDDFY